MYFLALIAAITFSVGAIAIEYPQCKAVGYIACAVGILEAVTLFVFKLTQVAAI